MIITRFRGRPGRQVYTARAGRSDDAHVPPRSAEPPHAADQEGQPAATNELTLGEAGGLAAVLAIAAVGTASLALAQVGHHDGLVAVLSGLLLSAGLVALTCAVGGVPRIRFERGELVLLAVVLLAALWSFLPGFPYASVDKDPGAYVAHAFVVAREGSANVEDPVASRGIEPTRDAAGRFAGIRPVSADSTTLTSQFFPYFSTLLATALDVAGERAVFNLNPLLAAVSIAVLTVAARRAFGTRTAAVMAALLLTSMMQVWQAKYPSTEIPAQLFLVGALLGAAVAASQRVANAASLSAAFVSGVCLGTGFLVRPDGFLYILLGATVVAGIIAMSSERIDRRVGALAAGIALTLPFALYDAYVIRGTYSASNGVPGLLQLLAALALIVGCGFLGRWVRLVSTQRWPRPAETVRRNLIRWRQPACAVAVSTFGLLLLALYHRETLLGRDYHLNPFGGGETIRSYNERNMIWFSWYLTPLGLVVMWIGSCVLAFQRWTLPRSLLVLPGLAFLPLYVYDARVSMRLMWWVRRFIPAVVPGVMLLIAVAVVWAVGNSLRRSSARWSLRLTGGVVVLVLLVRFTSQSLPLHSHREMDGSWDAAASVAATAGDEDGVFLYTEIDEGIYDPLRNTAGAVLWIFGQTAARLPDDYRMSTIERYQAAFPHQPVFIVTDTDHVPPRLPTDRFELAGAVDDEIIVWDEPMTHVPDRAVAVPQYMTIWRLVDD